MMERINTNFVQKFLKMEPSAGTWLFLSAVMAMVIANTPLAYDYSLLSDTPIAVQVGSLASAFIGFFVLKSQFSKSSEDHDLSNRTEESKPQ